LQENGEGGVDVGNIIDQESASGSVEAKGERENHIGLPCGRFARCSGVSQGTDACLRESNRVLERSPSYGFLFLGTLVPQNSRVYAIIKGGNPGEVGFGANPVVVRGLVCSKNKGVALGCEYPDRIYSIGFSADTVSFDYSQLSGWV
jgi:hypothetical protein